MASVLDWFGHMRGQDRQAYLRQPLCRFQPRRKAFEGLGSWVVLDSRLVAEEQRHRVRILDERNSQSPDDVYNKKRTEGKPYRLVARIPLETNVFPFVVLVVGVYRLPLVVVLLRDKQGFRP